MSIGSFKKLQYILGNLQGHMHVQGCVPRQSCAYWYAQERAKKTLIYCVEMNLQALSKQEGKAKTDV